MLRARGVKSNSVAAWLDRWAMRPLPSSHPQAVHCSCSQPAARWCPKQALGTPAHPEPGPWGAASLPELFRKDSHPFPNETE